MESFDLIQIFDMMVIPRIEYYDWQKIFVSHCQIYADVALDIVKDLLEKKIDKCETKNILYNKDKNFDYIYPQNTAIKFTFEIYNFSMKENDYNIRKKYKICSVFIPLLTFHTFNIVFGKDKVCIYQSWFQTQTYSKIHEFTKLEYNNWIKQLLNCFNNLIENKNIVESFDTIEKLFTYDKKLIKADFVKNHFSDKDDIQININIESCNFIN